MTNESTPDTDLPMWWGYRHQSGSIHLKRWWGDHADYTTDCDGNEFVALVVRPFPAASHGEATRILYTKLGAKHP